MRVLVVAAPLLGHVFPLIPLALALREAGHDVVVATGGEALRVRDSGLHVEDVVPGNVRFGPIALRIVLTHPVMAKRELEGSGRLDFVSRMFGTVGDAMTKPLRALAARWKPDVVVHEPLAAAGSVLGVPSVVHDVPVFDGLELTRAVGARMKAEVRSPATVLRTAPPSLGEFPGGEAMRFVAYSGGGEVPRWLAEPSGRPRVLVSRSTVPGPGAGKMTAAVVRAAGRVDAEFVLVRPERTDGLPDNVRAVGWVPIPRVLPLCDGIVHHGGAGTLLGALAAGVPQLVEPGPGDRTTHADAVTRRGAGLRAGPRDVTPELLTRLIEDSKLQRAAGEVRAEMAAMPSPADVAARWESLVRAE
ncbi:nucleotide disphospho-sugar-binding domain-containing protein [Lentzea jiangxiensis]|uniref:UDP:flavonoid glycosyltransferase YjiC, YdhE family n=1 Tax=Lentzea jiangxiensis TaxID=641025 RepID=A0A1H0FF78_9PSEU|nr:nucleotide disphospho-sugar-binding domain-containing protein [Lentzea jiangxiensis]SDN93049.1 UDP:flavonoid glycosyltransferase YjiC, YdhE family [Lentzea jiangxiensis]